VVYNPESGKKIASEIIDVEDFIGVKSYKAKGKRITTFAVDQFNWLEPVKPDPEPSEPSDDSEYSENSEIPDERLGFAEGTQTQLF
jgi:topoisomerase-4 subunit A